MLKLLMTGWLKTWIVVLSSKYHRVRLIIIVIVKVAGQMLLVYSSNAPT